MPRLLVIEKPSRFSFPRGLTLSMKASPASLVSALRI